MDPLSGSASIIAVLQLTTTVIHYLNAVKDASNERTRLRSELCSIDNMLCILKNKATEQGDSWSMTLKSLCLANGPLEQLKTTLERLNKKLIPTKGSKKTITAVTWPFHKGEINEILGTIERQKTLIAFAQQNDHMALSKAIREDILDTKSELGKLGNYFDQVQHDERRDKIRQWLKPPDPSINLNTALKERSDETGTWFTQSSIAKEWEITPASFLWLHGIPGCGKTILSSTIIESTVKHCSSDPSLALLYFYFNFNDPEKQRTESLLRSLLCQLTWQCLAVPGSLDSLYVSCGDGQRQPGSDALLTVLHQIMGMFHEVYLVIDALDESTDIHELLESLRELSSWRETNYHILVTSRRIKIIGDSMELLASDQICIQSLRLNDDIRSYIRGRLQSDPKMRRWQNQPKVQREIEDSLTEKTDGMFRWAACQLDSLGNCLNLPHLRKALASLPKTLDETYARILCNIDEEYHQYTIKILQWLTYSARPLYLEELAETITIDITGSPRFDPENRLADPLDILTICGSLISLDRRSFDYEGRDSMTVRLAHFSVKEYLISRRILEGAAKKYSVREFGAHTSIRNDCLAYLMDADIKENFRDFPLITYAEKHWDYHARMAEQDASFEPNLIMELFLAKRDVFAKWLRMKNQESRYLNTRRAPGEICSPLYHACEYGLYRLVAKLLDEGADVNATGGRHGYPLHAAIGMWRDKTDRQLSEIVHSFLDRGFHVNAYAQNALKWTALDVAISQGRDAIVEILLERGADPNIRHGVSDTPLQRSIGHCSERIVKLLVEKGADVNAPGGRAPEGRLGTALHVTAYQGSVGIAQCLLDKSADINAQDDRFGTPLQMAFENGHPATGRLLLEQGADIDALAGFPLLEAFIKRDHHNMALLLQNYSTKNLTRYIEITDSLYVDNVAQFCIRNPSAFANVLTMAGCESNEEMVQVLLDYLAKLGDQSTSNTTDTAFHTALRGDRHQILHELLAGGPDLLDKRRDYQRRIYPSRI